MAFPDCYSGTPGRLGEHRIMMLNTEMLYATHMPERGGGAGQQFTVHLSFHLSLLVPCPYGIPSTDGEMAKFVC